jgi:hypothetical protein
MEGGGNQSAKLCATDRLVSVEEILEIEMQRDRPAFRVSIRHFLERKSELVIQVETEGVTIRAIR